jgi:uncharacterized protein YjbI with pentapeptide repeats
MAVVAHGPKISAEDNLWYLLATLYGRPLDLRDDLVARNRVAWNRYMAAEIGDELRFTLIESGQCSTEELTPLSQDELQTLQSTFVDRSGTSISIADIPKSIDFSNVEFDLPLFALRFVFPKSTTFSGATFSGHADFRSAAFSGIANFASTTFSEVAHFRGATFSGRADFHSATFAGTANFRTATFADADFASTTFSGVANFSSATFSGTANFSNATFSGDAIFGSATIPFGNFGSTAFSGIAFFGSATFSDLAGFDRATFADRADFHSAAFSGIADFRSATFSDSAQFSGATFSGRTDFQWATIGRAAFFVNAEMRSPTSFNEVRFSEPPHFFGAKLHEGTGWHDVRWPKAPKDASAARDYVDAYERLKLEMDRLKKHGDELDFFAREQQSRRVLLGFWKGLPIAVYGFLCDYGRSYVRPLSLIGATVLVGTFFFWAHLVGFWIPALADPGHTGQAIGLSFANTLGILGIRKDFVDPALLQGLPGWLKVVSTIQTLLGIVLLFLFGLAIRNRFRMK